MPDALVIEHNPPGYRMEVTLSEFGNPAELDDRYVVFRTGQLRVIALDKHEVKQVIEWLQRWLNEEKGV